MVAEDLDLFLPNKEWGISKSSLYSCYSQKCTIVVCILLPAMNIYVVSRNSVTLSLSCQYWNRRKANRPSLNDYCPALLRAYGLPSSVKPLLLLTGVCLQTPTVWRCRDCLSRWWLRVFLPSWHLEGHYHYYMGALLSLICTSHSLPYQHSF